MGVPDLDRSRLSRRQLLKLAGLAGFGGVVAACAPTASTNSGAGQKAVPSSAAAPAQATQAAPAVVKSVSLTMWVQRYYVPDANKVVQEAADAAAKQGGFSIDVEFLPWEDTSYAKWSAALAANNLPDIGMPPGYPSQYQAVGKLHDLSGLFEEIGKSGGGWYDYVKSDATMGGKQWWIPILNETALAHYRTDLFEGAGYKVPLESLDALLDAAKKITKPEKNLYGIGMGMSHGDWPHNFLPVMWAFGAKFQDEKGNLAVDSPEMLKALTWYTELYTKWKVVPPGATSWDPSSNNTAYITGQVAFISNPGSTIGQMKKDHTDVLKNTAFAPVPGLPPKTKPTAPTNLPGLFVTTDSKAPDKAQLVIKALISEQFYPKYLEAAQSNFFSVLKGYSDIPFFAKDPLNKQIIQEVLPYSRPRAWPYVGTPTFSEADSDLLWGKMFQRVCVDKWTPRQALDEFAQKVKAIDEKYKKKQ